MAEKTPRSDSVKRRGRRPNVHPFSDLPSGPLVLVPAPSDPSRTLDLPPDEKLFDGQEISTAEAKRLLKTKAQELLDADAKQLPRLTKEIQRLRVVLLILNEADTGDSDPQVHKELGLLNRLITGKGLEGFDGDEEQDRRDRQQQAESLLLTRGVDPAAAGRLVRVLQAVMGAGTTNGPGPDPDQDTAPDAPAH